MPDGILLVLEGVVALTAGYLVWSWLGVFAEADSYPPRCANAYGHRVPCDRGGLVAVAILGTILVAWAGLLVLHQVVLRRK